MAKTDVTISAGLSIDEVLVSQTAKDRIVRLRAQMRDLKKSYEGLGAQLAGTQDFSERERLLLSQREAVNRASSVGRRLGYSPEQMGQLLATRSNLNRELSAVRSGSLSISKAAVNAELKAQKQKELYEWLVDAAEVVTSPDVDSSRPIVQRARRRVKSQLGTMLMTPGVEGIIGDERARKAAELYDKLSENTEASTSLVSTIRSGIAAGAGGIAFGSMLSAKAASALGNRITPFDELRGDLHQAFKATGGVIGAAIGSLAGPIGAAVGGAVGAWLGGYAERSKSSSDAAKADTIQMLRMRNLYNRGSFNSAMLAANLGYMDFEDYQGIASAINVAPYSAAFGKISNDQWIGLSLLPNYMAALFGGASPEQAMDALQQDLDMRGPGLGQFAVSQLGGLGLNENVRAFVMSSNYQRWRDQGYTLQQYEDTLQRAAPGYEEAIMEVAKENRRVRDLSIRRGTWTLSKYNYVGQPAAGAGEEVAGTIIGGKALPKFDFDEMGFVRRELIINIDNNKVDVGPVYTYDGDWLRGATSYAIGSNQ